MVEIWYAGGVIIDTMVDGKGGGAGKERSKKLPTLVIRCMQMQARIAKE